MPSSRKLSFFSALVVALSMGCDKPQSSTGGKDQKSGVATATDTARLQLKWLVNAGFAGDIAAEANSPLDGLRIEARPGGPAVNAIAAVLNGQAQFGIATGDQLLVAVEGGAPLVAIALAYQRNPLSWITRKRSGISSPKALRGRNVALTYIDDEPLFRAIMSKSGLRYPTDVRSVRVQYDLAPFLTAAVDAYPVYRNTQGVDLAILLGTDSVSFIGPDDVGIVSYSNLYFATRSTIAQRPDLVRRFLASIRRGWEFARQDSARTVALLLQRDPSASEQSVRESLRQTLKLVFPTDTTTFGAMSLEGWQSTQQVLLNAGVLKRPLRLDSVFTTASLPRAIR